MTRIPYRTLRYAAALLVLVTTGPALADPSNLISVVADGKPWTLTQSDGGAGKVTLFADGKGTIQLGKTTLAPTWRTSESGQLCLKPSFLAPELCSTLRRVGTAIIGSDGSSERFRLTRP